MARRRKLKQTKAAKAARRRYRAKKLCGPKKKSRGYSRSRRKTAPRRRKKSYSAHRSTTSTRQHERKTYEDAARKYDDAVGKLMRVRGINPRHALLAGTWAELNSHPSVAPHHKKSREAYRRLVGR